MAHWVGQKDPEATDQGFTPRHRLYILHLIPKTIRTSLEQLKVGDVHLSGAKISVNYRGTMKNFWYRKISWIIESERERERERERGGGVIRFCVDFFLTVPENFVGDALVLLKVSGVEILYT